MQATLDRIKYILDNGRVKGDRTGTGTISIPTMDFTFDTRKDTPMLTSRKQKWENPFYEWKWFLSGSQVIDYLLEVGCPYWNEWATKEPVYAQVPMQIYERMQWYCDNIEKGKVTRGELLRKLNQEGHDNLDKWFNDNKVPNTKEQVVIPKNCVGPMYGFMMIHWPTTTGKNINQIDAVMHSLRTNPDGRRHLVNMWNPEFLPDERFSPQENVKAGLQALAPCHFAFEFLTDPMTEQERIDYGLEHIEGFGDVMAQTDAGYLSVEEALTAHDVPKHWCDLKFHMRSNDTVLGQPANLLGYHIFLMMITQQVNMAKRFVHFTGSNVHVYRNHLEGIREWMERPVSKKRPKLKLVKKPASIYEYDIDCFELTDYECQPHIKFPVAV